MSESGDPDDDGETDRLIQETRRKNEAYEAACRLRLWEIGTPAFAVFACVLCLYVCEDCLLGVMVFCAALCFKDWVLVIVFFTSLVLLLARHPMDSKTMHRITDAGYVFLKPE
jgi:hypothetical protein